MKAHKEQQPAKRTKLLTLKLEDSTLQILMEDPSTTLTKNARGLLGKH